METIILHSITVDELMDKLRSIIREELKVVLQQDQLWAHNFYQYQYYLSLGKCLVSLPRNGVVSFPQ